MEKIVLASSNQGKVKEFQQLFKSRGWHVLPQSQFRVDDAEETGLSFVENAIIKARNAAKISGLPALADDSGLEVDALRGRPGIYSARFSGDDATDQSNNEKLLKLMTGIPEAERTARFQCALVLMRHAEDPTPLIFQGSWEGLILTAPQGENGFGYDPLFWALDQQCSSANLAPEVKNQVSHRARAVERMMKSLA
ncbi:MAG: RdgB/HAM1 family non-canonical purine NTP pyrophosphatase [Sinobacterium sp.]|nr:RdgB/HAM1 family non-canonical purine NTP pyrophosphatase [Sinobacterium sp.]